MRVFGTELRQRTREALAERGFTWNAATRLLPPNLRRALRRQRKSSSFNPTFSWYLAFLRSCGLSLCGACSQAEFGRFLRQKMRMQKLSKRALARLSGISRGMIDRLLAGLDVQTDRVLELCHALGIQVAITPGRVAFLRVVTDNTSDREPE